ncbi:MAG: hypothetical protein JW734_05610 [Candidatus Omnitrophica bacterium]|nr:hypothetical protein [Candidatus Omnitrophota bacterium]
MAILKTLLQTQNSLRYPAKIYRHTRKSLCYLKNVLLWDERYSQLRQPKIKSAIPHDPEVESEIIKKLREKGIEVVDFEINIDDYRKFVAKAGYDKFPDYYQGGKGRNFIEKSLEHYLAAKLLGLSKEDVYIDIAASGSPAADIYHDIYGCVTYKQDLVFPRGLQGNTIGSDASDMPLEDGFASKMGLHCSFEHFEQDSDKRFIKEAKRVLGKGGKLCIVPLYLFKDYAIQTDPSFWPKEGISFEQDAVVYCARGWKNRHGRFYDVPHFVDRIIKNLEGLKLTIYAVTNAKAVHPRCYLKFAAIFEKL